MGVIFFACAYDIEAKIRSVYDADKFHANCYAHSGAVFSMHYLLRQKPYRIMWGGLDVVEEDNIQDFSKTEDLLGISTYVNFEDFVMNYENIEKEDYYEKIKDKVKFVNENYNLWEDINVEDEALAYFDWDTNHSVKYSGFLINHTKKLAVDLADYHSKSKFILENIVTAIDPIPVLTETGGGSRLAFLKGVTYDSTENLSETWCGDLLQIVDELPSDYKLIDCCFASLAEKTKYCYRIFGVDKDDFVVLDKNGNRLKVVSLDIFFDDRVAEFHVKAEKVNKGINFQFVKILEYDKEGD